MAVYGNVENIDAIVLANVEAGARHIDGFSPIVETEQTATGEHITITDKEAVHEFDIRNGSAMAVRVEDETAYFTSDGAQYQPVEISDENEYFETDTVEGALDELYEASADIKNDVEDLQDALETEQTAVRSIALGGTGADNAEEAIENLGIADYIVEQASNYTKWASGRAECWGIATGINVNLTQVKAGLEVYAQNYNIALPIPMKKFTLNGVSRFSTGYNVPFGGSDYGGVLSSTAQVHLTDYFARIGNDMSISWVAKGYWK